MPKCQTLHKIYTFMLMNGVCGMKPFRAFQSPLKRSLSCDDTYVSTSQSRQENCIALFMQWNIMGPSQVSNIPFEYIHAGLNIVCVNARLEMIIQKAHMPSLIELGFCRLQFHGAVPFVSIKNITTKEWSRFLQSFFLLFQSSTCFVSLKSGYLW